MSKVKFNSEKDLEDYICEFIEEHGTCPVTGEIVHHWYRQVNLGGYGITDIIKIEIEHDGGIIVTVLELKIEKLTIKCMAQVMRYMDGINHFISDSFKRAPSITVKAELLGTSFNNSDFDTCFVFNNLGNLDMYTYDINLEEGISFDGVLPLWKVSDPCFPGNKSIINEVKKSSLKQAREYKNYIDSIDNVAKIVASK